MMNMPETSKSLLEEIENYFAKQNLVSLATVEGDQPRVRIVSLIHPDGCFYVITGARRGADTAKVRQIRENPRVEFVMQVEREGKIGNIRAEATASISEDSNLKTRLFDEVEWVKDYFVSQDDPDYVVLRIDVKSYEYSVPGRPEVIKIDMPI
jgi:general stress protein 26